MGMNYDAMAQELHDTYREVADLSNVLITPPIPKEPEPKMIADKKPETDKTESEKADSISDEGKRKKKRRHGKVPLRYRPSVLERLRKYQTKLAMEHRQKKEKHNQT